MPLPLLALPFASKAVLVVDAEPETGPTVADFVAVFTAAIAATHRPADTEADANVAPFNVGEDGSLQLL